MAFDLICPECKTQTTAEAMPSAGIQCGQCGAVMHASAAPPPALPPVAQPPARPRPIVRPRRPVRRVVVPTTSDGGGNSAISWLIFFLIFGVGNAILYATTGWIIIPK